MSASPASDPGRSASQILVVSKSVETLADLVQRLRAEGQPNLTAASLEDAWFCLQALPVSMVVLDVTGRAFREFTFAWRVRSNEATRRVPFLFLISEGDPPPSFGDEVAAGAAEGWLRWPQHKDQLGGWIRRLTDAAHPAGPRLAPGAAGVTRAVRTAFSGRLGSVDVPRLIALIEPTGMTGELVVEGDGREGRIYFVRGAIWHALFGEVHGREALFAVFGCRQGSFRFDHAEPVAVRSVYETTTGLLLEGLRLQDEARATIRRVGKTSEVAALAAPRAPWPQFTSRPDGAP